MSALPGLTKHTILVCPSKRDRGVAMQATLSSANYKTLVAPSLYEALRIAQQDMPHLIIADSELEDGTACLLYDRLQQDPILKSAPIIVNVLKKTREVLEPIAKRKFATFFVGQPEPQAFLQKIAAVIAKSAAVSPYAIDVTKTSLGSEVVLALEATVLGVREEQLVVQSSGEIDPAASVVCLPKKPGMGPAVLRNASNLRQGQDMYNVFPLARISGTGRKWISQLPQIQESGSGGGGATGGLPKTLLFFDANQARFDQFKTILDGYGITSVYAKNLKTAAAMVKATPQDFGAVYLSEVVNDGSGIAWKEAYGAIPEKQRPNVIIATSSQTQKSTDQIRYLRRPFGLGVFVEVVEASFNRADVLASQGEQAKSIGGIVPVVFQSPAKLLALDECGGVLQLRFPLALNSRMVLEHEVLRGIWEGQSQVVVSQVAQVEGHSDLWQARFDMVVGAGSSKSKYWATVGKALQKYVVADAASSQGTAPGSGGGESGTPASEAA